MATAGNITAVLTLNSSGFQTGLSNSLKAVESFKKSVGTVGKDVTSMESALKMLDTVLEVAIRQIAEFNRNVGNLSNFNKYAQSVNKIANALRILSSSEVDVVESMNLINNMFKYFQGSLNGIEVKVKGVASSNNQLVSSTERVRAVFTGLTTSVNPAKMTLIDYGRIERETYLEGQRQAENLRILQREFRALALGVEQFNAVGTGAVAKERELASASNQASSSLQRQSSASDRATTSTNRQATATRGLSKAMSSLKMMGTMVASMMVYNFAHNLITATRETVNAKSEMEGYFQMLGYSAGEIDHFNGKLDEMIQKFPRINKYSLGETVSSIGVEFELTTREMEKAMPVVSMITSEYLRAGRNANEASLAVKDILQGEFQRLSRETGVKGDQLKEAGWSGDKTDVMGLLEALEKVGKDRNWDVFVTKANSLNDAVMILQNRFGEWSAEMVNVIQPTILGVFNALMDVGGMFSQIFGGIWKSLNNNSLSSTAIKIGLVSTALIHGLKYLTMYRTGANLLQTSTMSLRKAITGLVFGINVETMATKRGYEAILMKILGLKAETVEQKGLIGAINQSIVRKGAETVAENTNTASKEANAIITGVQSKENIGFIAGIKAVIFNKALDTEATLTLSGAMGVLTATMLASPFTWFVAGLMAIAGAFYIATGGLSDHYDKLKSFNETVENSSDVMQQHYDWLHSIGESAGYSSQKYKDAKESVNNFRDALTEATNIKDRFETEFNNITLTLDTSFSKNLKGYGFSDEDISKLTKNLDFDEGYNTYYHALQVINKQEDNAKKTQKDILDKMDKRGASDEEIADKSDQIKQHEANLIKHSAEHNTSEDWWSGTWSGLLAGLDSIQLWLDYATEDFANWLNDFNKDWQKLSDDLYKAVTGIPDWLSKGVGDIGGRIRQWVDDVWKSIDDSINYVVGAWNNNIVKPLTDLWNGFWSFEWLNFGGDSSEGSGIAKHIDGSGFLQSLLPSITLEDVTAFANEHIILPVTEWWNGFIANPLGFLGLPQIDFGALIGSFFGGLEGIASFIATDLTPRKDAISNTFNISNLVSIFTTGLQTIFTTASTISASVSGVFSNLKSMIWGHIQGILTNVTTTFTNIKTSATNQINGLKDGVTGAIHKVMDAFKQMRDSILDSAKRIMDGVKEKFDKVKDTIGGFYHKLTNPSEWFSGSGTRSYSSQPKPRTARRLFAPVTRTVTGKHGAGVNPYTKPQQQVSLKELVDMLGGDKTVNLGNFLSLFDGSGFGGWDFAKAHKDTIFKEGKSWNAKSPSLNGVTLGDGFPVRRFWSGEAKGFTWSEFMSVATAIFSAIPYKFYMDSDWKGNWVSALLSGAMNCSDGADALIALANLFGFSGSKQHTNLKDGTGHFFAIINGKKMDTTHFQNSGSWSPLSGAGVPTRSYVRRNGQTQDNKTVNVTNDFTGATIYGIDDLDSRIKESTKEAIREEFNDPYTVAI